MGIATTNLTRTSRMPRTTKPNPNPNVAFRTYITFNNGEIEFAEKAKPKCGEIWMCDLGHNDGSVQSGYRPVFIISNDTNNQYSPTINVFPLTTKMNKRNLPVHVELWNYKKYGLSAPSTILVEQPMTVPSDRFVKKAGSITDAETLEKICRAMGIQFPILVH